MALAGWIVSMLKTCCTNKEFVPGSLMFPAAIRAHKTAMPSLMKILRRVSIMMVGEHGARMAVQTFTLP